MTVKKQGGSLRGTLPADAGREVGIDPQDLDAGDGVEFLVSKSKQHPGRLVLDLREDSTA